MIYKNTKLNVFEGNVFTFDYSVLGSINFPNKSSSTDYLNRRDSTMIPITNAMVRKFTVDTLHSPDQAYLFTSSFMAIPKNRILWVYGGNPSAKTSKLTEVSDRSLIVLYQEFFLRGFMTIAERIRTVDYFSHRYSQNKPFAEMQQVSFGVVDPKKLFSEVEEREVFDFVSLNLQNATGVCEINSE